MLPCGQLGEPGLAPFGCGVLRRRLAIKGRYRIGWWRVNGLFSETLCDVALRAIG